MIKNYFKIAWRSIQKNKLYSLINILGLSLGIAVCLVITLFVKDEFSFDRFQANKDQIFRLVADEYSPNGSKSGFGDTGMVHGAAFKNQIPEIETLVRVKSEMYNIRHQNEIFSQDALSVDSSFFNLFTAEFIEGSPYKSLESSNSIVISETVAKRFFGENKALGKNLEIEVEKDFKNFTITGVTKKSPQNSTIQIELLKPFDYSKPQDDQWINFYLNTFFKIKKGANLANIEKKFAAIFANDAKEQLAKAKKDWNYENRMAFKLQPFVEMHLSRDYRAQNGLKLSSNKTLSYVLSGLALFILIIACINFINISISHSLQRSKEIGIRKVVGGQRKQLIAQFLSESFLLNFAAFILALLWVFLALPTFNSLSSKSLAFEYLFDYKLILIFITIFIFTGFLAGFYPAIVLSGYQPVETLYGKFKLKGRNVLQKTLIVVQFGLATFFIMMTIVQFRQVNLFTSKDLGYNDKDIIIVNSYGADRTKGNVFVEELLRNPNVISAAPRNAGTWITVVTANGDQQMGPDMNVIDDKFIKTLGLKVVKGRNFSTEFPGDSSHSVLVNEAFAKEAGWKQAIGQNVKIMNKDNYQVVGVVKDYHFSSLYEKVRPQIFTSNLSYNTYGTFFIKTNGQNLPQMLDFIKTKFKSVFPTKPYAYELLAENNIKQYEKEFQMRQIIFWASAIMIFISSMGLFGLSVLTTEKRKKEIGVRKVLGASVMGIVQKLSIDFVKLICIAFVIFSPLAYFVATNLLENYPFRINIGVDIFAICLTGMLLVTIITVSYQAIKAALLNPVESLKTE